MSAAHQRRRLAAAGRDLLAQDGGPGERRGAALLRSLSHADRPTIGFEDLARLPDWLRLPRAALRRLAERAALLSIAPALTRTIDGSLLGAHARCAGDDVMDWALAHAAHIPDGGLPAIEPEQLAARGWALMRAVLPEPLRDLVAPAAAVPEASPALARLCLTEALESEPS